MLPELHIAPDDDDRPARAASPLRLVPPQPTLAGRDRRVKVCATTRVTTDMGDRIVRLVGLSANTALLFVPEPVGAVGHCVDLFLPVIGGREIQLTTGIDSVERVLEGYAVTLRFIVAEPATRRELHSLLSLLLAGEETRSHQQPGMFYDVLVCYGPTGSQRANLEEISPTGLSMRVAERFVHELRVDVLVPALRNGPALQLRGRVTGQRLSREGGYHTAVSFDALDHKSRGALSALLADLMCR
jgi:PilZ domain-containing protein